MTGAGPSLRLPLASMALVSILALGCNDLDGIEEPSRPIEPLLLPGRETAVDAVKRFVAVYEQKNLAAYDALFTADFRFEFSAAVDPDLAQHYGSGWSRADERVATGNLFNGGTNDDGELQLPALAIDLALVQMIPQDDAAEGRDPETHAVLFTAVVLSVQLPPTEDNPDGSAYFAGGANPALHRLFLVRGDAADSLSEDQPADDQHWYIWRWRDESTATSTAASAFARGDARPAAETKGLSWGALKDLYR